MTRVFILLSFCLLALLSGCKSEETFPDIEGVIVDITLNISVVDQNGKNLIDSNLPNSIKSSDIKIFYERGGEKISSSQFLHEIFDKIHATLDNYNGYKLISNYEPPVIKVYLEAGEKMKDEDRKIQRTYIQWDEDRIDTLEYTTLKSGPSQTYTDLIYNGEKMDIGNSKKITIVK